MAAQVPYSERPILVEYLQQEDHYHYDRSDRSIAERRPLFPQEVWLQVAQIPGTPDTPGVPPPQSAWPGTMVPPVSGISNVGLVAVPGSNDLQWRAAVASQFQNMVPANYANDAYRPTLKDAAGVVIPYDPSVWVADGVREMVEFKYTSPAALGYAVPLNISYWQYIGTFPNSGITDIANEGMGTGEIWDFTAANVAYLRSLIADSTSGKEGIEITTDVPNQVVVIGNTLNGANSGSAFVQGSVAQVFSAKSGAFLNFRSLIAGNNITVTTVGDDITIDTGTSVVSSIANEGSGAQIYDTVTSTGTSANLRTLLAGPGLGILQGVPATTEIQITADEMSADGSVDFVPATLDLFVSAAGSDTTGDGTVGLPYATLPRAFRDVRVVGYDVSASVTVIGAISIADCELGQGTRGRRATPVVLKGTARTVLEGGLAVSGVVTDTPTGFYDVFVGVAPATPFAVGQIVQFISGPATGVECFIAAVISTTQFRIPYSGTAPVVTDLFNTEDLASTVSLSASAELNGHSNTLVMQDFVLDLTAGGTRTLTLNNQPTLMSGVRIVNNSSLASIVNSNGLLQAGGSLPGASTVPTLGVFLDNTISGVNLFSRLPGQFIDTVNFYGSVFVGATDSSIANTRLFGQFATIQDCYFETMGTVTVNSGRAIVMHVWFSNSVPTAAVGGTLTAGGAIDVSENAAAIISNFRVATSSEYGIKATTGGEIIFDTATSLLGDCVLAAVYSERAGHIVCNGGTAALVAGGGVGYRASNQGRITATDSLIANDTTSTGIVIDTGSKLCGTSVICSSNAAYGMLVQMGSAVELTGTIIADGNASGGVSLDDSTCVIDTFSFAGNTGPGLTATRARLTTGGSASCVSSGSFAGAGILAQNSQIEMAACDLICDANALAGIDLSESRLQLQPGASSITTSTNAGPGMRIAGSTLIADCNVAVSGNTGGIISTAAGPSEMPSIIGFGALAVGSNTLYGIDLRAARMYVRDTLSVDANTGSVGLSLSCSDVCCDTLAATNASSTGDGVFLTDNSSLRATTFTSDSNGAGSGLRALNGSSVVVTSTIACNSNGVNGIRLESASQLMAKTVTIGTNADTGISVISSRLVAGDGTSSFDSANSVAGSGLMAQESEIVVNATTCSFNSNFLQGVDLALSTLRVLAPLVAMSGNSGVGALVVGSTLLVDATGADTAMSVVANVGGGIRSSSATAAIENTSVIGIGGPLDCTNNAGIGIQLRATRMYMRGAIDVSSIVATTAAISVDNGSTCWCTLLTGNLSSATPAAIAVSVDQKSELYSRLGVIAIGDNVANNANIGVSVTNGSKLVTASGGITVKFAKGVGIAGRGLTVQNSEVRSIGDVTITNGVSTGIVLTTGALVIIVGNLDASSNAAGISMLNAHMEITGTTAASNSTTGIGISVTQGSYLCSGAITASTNQLSNITATLSTIICTATITASSSVTSTGVDATNSTIGANSITASTNKAINIVAVTSTITTTGDVTCVGVAAATQGIQLINSMMRVGGAVSSTNNQTENISIVQSSTLAVTGAITATGSVTSTGVNVTNSTITAVAITASTNKATNILAVTSTITTTGNVTCVGAAAATRGIQLSDSMMRVGGALSSTNNQTENILMVRSSTLAVVGAITATGSIAGNGISMADSTIGANSITASTNKAINIVAVTSTIVTTGDVTCVGVAAATQGIQLNNSVMRVGGAVSSTNNQTENILMVANSTLAVTGAITATGSIASSGISMTSSTITAIAITASTNKATNIVAVTSTITTTANVTCVGVAAATRGIQLNDSMMRVGGAVSSTNNQTENILMAQSSTLAVIGAITATGSIASSGISMTDSTIGANSITASTNMATNIVATTSTIITTGNVTCVGVAAATRGIQLNNSVMRVGGAVSSTNNQTENILMAQSSTLAVIGAITATGSIASSGINIAGSTIACAGTLSTGANSLTNLVATAGSAITADIVLASTSATGGGISLTSSMMNVSTSITANSNNGTNILMVSNSVLDVAGTVGASTSTTARGLDITLSTVRIGGAVAANTNPTGNLVAARSTIALSSTLSVTGSTAGNGISLGTTTLSVAGIITVTGNFLANILMTLSTLNGSIIVASGSVGTRGIDMTLSTLNTTSTINADTNPTGNIVAVLSVIRCGGALSAINGTVNGGVILTSSELWTSSDLTATGNNGNNINMIAQSMLNVNGAITASGSVTGSGIIAVNSTIKAISITASTNKLVNITATVSTIATTSIITCVGVAAAAEGITLVNSFMRAGGALSSTNNQTQNILMSAGSTLVAATITATGSITSNGISAAGSTIETDVGALIASSNAGTNILLSFGSSLIVLSITATGSTGGSGLSVTNSKVVCGGLLNTDGNSLTNLTMNLGSMVTANNVQASTSGTASGISLTLSKLIVLGTVAASSNNGTNILLATESTLNVSGAITASTSTTGSGISASNSVLKADSIVASTNKTANITATVSMITTLTTIICVGVAAAATGITLVSSAMRAGGAVSSTGNQTQNILMSANSKLIATAITATGSITSTGCDVSGSTVTCTGTLNVGSNSLTNLVATAGSAITAGAVQAGTSALGSGIDLTSSTLNASGSITASGNRLTNITTLTSTVICAVSVTASSSVTLLGISLTNSTLTVSTDLTSSSNSESAISAAAGSKISVGGALVTNGSINAAGVVLSRSELTVAGAYTASGNAGNGILAFESRIYVNSATIPSARTIGISLTETKMQSLGTVSVTLSIGHNISLVTGSSLIASAITATGSTGGSGLSTSNSTVVCTGILNTDGNFLTNIVATAGSAITANSVQASTSGTAGGISLTSSTMNAVTSTITASSNPTTNITLATESTMSAAGTITASSSTTGNGISSTMMSTINANAIIANTNKAANITATRSMIYVNLTITCVGVAAAATGITLINSVMRVGGTVSSTGNQTQNILMSAGSALVAGSVTATGSIANAGIDVAGSTIDTDTGAIDASSNNGLNITATNSKIVCGAITANSSTTTIGITLTRCDVRASGVTASTNSGANINVTESIVLVAMITANGSIASNGLSINQGSYLVANGAVTLTGNAVTNLSMVSSTVIFPRDAALSASGGTNLVITSSRFTIQNLNLVVPALTVTGGASAAAIVTGSSDVSIEGAVTISSTASTGLTITDSKWRTASDLNLSSASPGTTKLNLTNSSLIVDTGTLTVSQTAGAAGAGIIMSKLSTLSAPTIIASSNSTNLAMDNSTVNVLTLTTLTPASAGGAAISLTNASLLTVITTATATNAAGTTATSGLIIDRGSRAVLPRIDITGLYLNPVRVLARSSLVVLGLGANSTWNSTAGATAQNIALIDNSDVDLSRVDVSGTTFSGIQFSHNATGSLTTCSSAANGVDGILIGRGSRVYMNTITGAGNGGVGVNVRWNGHGSYLTATMAITGTGGDSKVGVNAAKTWALMDTSQEQHVNDFVFPVGILPITTTVTEMCTLVPST